MDVLLRLEQTDAFIRTPHREDLALALRTVEKRQTEMVLSGRMDMGLGPTTEGARSEGQQNVQYWD
jgi:hypothetical protein